MTIEESMADLHKQIDATTGLQREFFRRRRTTGEVLVTIRGDMPSTGEVAAMIEREIAALGVRVGLASEDSCGHSYLGWPAKYAVYCHATGAAIRDGARELAGKIAAAAKGRMVVLHGGGAGYYSRRGDAPDLVCGAPGDPDIVLLAACPTIVDEIRP